MCPSTNLKRHLLMLWDVILALVSVAIVVYMIHGGDDFADRTTRPTNLDMMFGIALVALVIEATRRTSGWIMPVIICCFIAYAFARPYLPSPWPPRGSDSSRLV